MAAIAEEAVRCFRSAGEHWFLTEAQCMGRAANVLVGRPDSSLSAEEAAAERLGHYAWSNVVTSRAHSLWMQTADFDQYEECCRLHLEICRQREMPWWTCSQGWLAVAMFHRGDWEQARGLALEAAKHELAGNAFHGQDSSALLLVDCYLGRREDALAMLESPDALPAGPGVSSIGAWTMLIRAVEGLVVLGEGQRAGALYPLLVGALETGTVMACHALRLTQTAAGIGAAAARLWERAEEHFETALRQAHEIPFISEQADARRWYAHMLLDRDASGDATLARQYLEEAIAIYQRIGMPRHVAMAEALLARA